MRWVTLSSSTSSTVVVVFKAVSRLCVIRMMDKLQPCDDKFSCYKVIALFWRHRKMFYLSPINTNTCVKVIQTSKSTLLIYTNKQKTLTDMKKRKQQLKYIIWLWQRERNAKSNIYRAVGFVVCFTLLISRGGYLLLLFLYLFDLFKVHVGILHSY